ncbi:MAG TPA: NAD(+)/NADH kinase [Pseudobdellovibrionaceae bacterium]|nr:NAD(+)/NADH kinase [Pseudobdellovibrionaceae bacterium]
MRASAKSQQSTRSKSTRSSSTRSSSTKDEPRSVGILHRPNSPLAVKKAAEVARWLTDRGHRVFAAPGQKIARDAPSLDTKKLAQLDLMLVLGGDGTYLGAVRLIGDRSIPVFGVNMGSLGFLTDTRVEDLFPRLQAALEDRLQPQMRSLLSVEVRRGRTRLSHQIALNDAVVERGSITHLINIDLHSENHLVGSIKADALVIATPTGSTAYNLAAGGPILHPEARSFVVTPVCPHALTSRPLIFPDHQSLRLKVQKSHHKAILTVDGVRCGELTDRDEVCITRHAVDHVALRDPDFNFFSLLREKLKFGERA